MSASKKLWGGLGVIIIVMLIILVDQIKTAHSITTRAEDLPLISPNMVEIATSATDPILGNPGASLTLVGFFDVTDDKSRELYGHISKLIKAHPDKIRFIWKDFPGSGFFTDPVLAHQAAHCAKVQNRFWPYLNDLMTSSRGLRESVLRDYANQENLNMPAWENCLTDQTTKDAVGQGVVLAQSLYLPEAPILFINNKLLNPDADIDLEQFLSTLITP